ncbi:MAG: hypothetical protein ABH805_00660 [Candidatus Nealsonbacteria bacterium]
MIEIIFALTFTIGLLGTIVILLRKAPLLSAMPESNEALSKILGSKIKEGSKNIPGVKDFSYEPYLHKALSKVRVFSLKTDRKTSALLDNLRQRNQQKRSSTRDNYWEELKKAKDGK